MGVALTNGRLPRKQLGDQLDRFDSILDGLSGALNESVADAAREGVKVAVKDAVIEMLTDPNLRVALHQATMPPREAKPTLWQRVKTRIRDGAAKVGLAVSAVVAGVREKARAVRETVNGTKTRVGLAWQLRKVMLVGLGIGLCVATFSYLTTHGLAAALSGAGAAATAVAVQVGIWVRRTVRRLAIA